MAARQGFGALLLKPCALGLRAQRAQGRDSRVWNVLFGFFKAPLFPGGFYRVQGLRGLELLGLRAQGFRAFRVWGYVVRNMHPTNSVFSVRVASRFDRVTRV